MKVREEKAPSTIGISNALSSIDFSDSFTTTNNSETLQNITIKIFGTAPKWIQFLFKVRNSLVRFLGLKTAMPIDYHSKFEVGGYVKFFKIYSIADDEIVLGADDSHLNFRAVIYNSAEPTFNIKVITLVQYHNLTGKIYMALIKPFHRWVVKTMVKQAYKKNL